MLQYTYQILEDKASTKLYFEVSYKNKQLQFIKVADQQWEMYFQGILIAQIYPHDIDFDYDADNNILNTCHSILHHTILNSIINDEAYQIVNSL